MSASSRDIAAGAAGGESQFICLECWTASNEDFGEYQAIRPDQVREIQKHFADLN